MLEMSYIREHQDEIRNVIERRHVKVDLDGLLQVDEQRRSSIQQVDMLRAKRNSLSEQIAKMSADERQETVSQVKSIKVELENLESGLTELESSYQSMVRDVPNLLSP